MMSENLLPSRFLFRFSAPIRYRKALAGPRRAPLDESFRLVNLGELEGQRAWADVRAAWSEEGLLFSIQVSGKRQPLWCRATRPEDSDSVQLWLDTRDVHTVHRASRFCHQFLFLPSGAGPKGDQPLVIMAPIHRAKENPKPIASNALTVRSEKRSDGYLLEALIPAEALTGFDPSEHPRLGFTYAIQDRELGRQTFSIGSEMPFEEDPSLWATLILSGGG